MIVEKEKELQDLRRAIGIAMLPVTVGPAQVAQTLEQETGIRMAVYDSTDWKQVLYRCTRTS